MLDDAQRADLREEIAKAIDPDAFAGCCGQRHDLWAEEALRAADAVLALPSLVALLAESEPPAGSQYAEVHALVSRLSREDAHIVIRLTKELEAARLESEPVKDEEVTRWLAVVEGHAVCATAEVRSLIERLARELEALKAPITTELHPTTCPRCRERFRDSFAGMICPHCGHKWEKAPVSAPEVTDETREAR